MLQLTEATPPAGGGNIDDEELDADVKVALTENEAEIRSYLIHNEPLSEETIEKFANIFWNSEPYRYISLGCIYTCTVAPPVLIGVIAEIWVLKSESVLINKGVEVMPMCHFCTYVRYCSCTLPGASTVRSIWYMRA